MVSSFSSFVVVDEKNTGTEWQTQRQTHADIDADRQTDGQCEVEVCLGGAASSYSFTAG